MERRRGRPTGPMSPKEQAANPDQLLQSDVVDLSDVRIPEVGDAIRRAQRSGVPAAKDPRSNPRVANALKGSEKNGKVDEEKLAADLARLQPLPDPDDEQSVAEWLRRVLPVMDPKDRYTKDLARALSRRDIRERAVTVGSTKASETQQ
jgi:hypothetical protein